MLNKLFIEEKVKQFLLEDIGHQDITTDNLDIDRNITATLISKDEGILAGLEIGLTAVSLIDPSIKIEKLKKDGDFIKKNEIITVIYGRGKSILKSERVMLNLIQKLSGIATNTHNLVKLISRFPVKLLDTRKTTPGLRAFEKYAVKVGGGHNHRFALYDMVMIKDNHITLAGGLTEAINQIKNKVSPMVKIEVEVSNLHQLKEALNTDADIIMLDNMTPKQVKEAVQITNNKKLLEVSGNITYENIIEYATTGVDFISSGAIIHSARWLEISLKFT